MKKQTTLTVQGKHVDHDQQKGQLQSHKSSSPLQPRPKYSYSTLANKTGSISVWDDTTDTTGTTQHYTSTPPAPVDHDKLETPDSKIPVAVQESIGSIPLDLEPQIHSTPNALPEHVFSIPLDMETETTQLLDFQTMTH